MLAGCFTAGQACYYEDGSGAPLQDLLFLRAVKGAVVV